VTLLLARSVLFPSLDPDRIAAAEASCSENRSEPKVVPNDLWKQWDVKKPEEANDASSLAKEHPGKPSR